jgi:hypothetical protein
VQKKTIPSTKTRFTFGAFGPLRELRDVAGMRQWSR